MQIGTLVLFQLNDIIKTHQNTCDCCSKERLTGWIAERQAKLKAEKEQAKKQSEGTFQLNNPYKTNESTEESSTLQKVASLMFSE